MKIVRVRDKEALKRAVGVIKRGGIVVFPTDTTYGLGVDATNQKAVQKLYKLKRRDKDKPMHVAVSNMEMAEQYAEIPLRAKRLAEKFLPGALTMILKSKGKVCDILEGENNSLGIRIPRFEFARKLAEQSGVPITATSANKSGDKAPYSLDEIQESFKTKAKDIDLAVDAWTLPHIAPSTLVDLTEKEAKILREGPISGEDIEKVVS